MKFFIIVFMVISLSANDISYSFSLKNKTPYQKEAIFLDVNITQENNSCVMFFKFSPKKSNDYSFKQIDFKEHEQYHALRHEYKYLIYPLKSGDINIYFNMIKSITTDDSVAYAISGDRDNIKGLVKKDIRVKLKPLLINVKKVPIDTVLVGNFKIDYTIDKNATKSYEPIYLHIDIEGKGYLKPLKLIPKNENYYIFMEKPIVKKDVISYNYAISGKSSFTIPKIDLKAFNPKTKKSYYLVIPSHYIDVKSIDSHSLLDSKNSPKELQKDIDWSWIGLLFSYIAVFIAGFLTPRDIFKRKNSKKNTIENKIALTKTHKELLKVLLSKNSTEYKEAINMLESVLYQNRKIALSEIKKELI